MCEGAIRIGDDKDRHVESDVDAEETRRGRGKVGHW
jgi:hypothetical protein